MNGQLDLDWVSPRLGALQRPESSGPTTGLSRAIAERLGIDVSIVRVAFVVLALAGGFGAILYVWGTALSTNSRGRRPIDIYLPGFAEWRPRTQRIAVVVSTLLASLLLTAFTPLPWLFGALTVLVLWMAGQGKLNSIPQRVRASGAESDGGPSDTELVDQWRRTMNAAIGPQKSRLPVVDLYSPAPEPASRMAAPARPTPDWLSGLAIAGVSLAAGVVAMLFSGGALLTMGTILTTAATLTLIFALTARSRRIPRPLLFLLALAMVPAGWIATQSSEAAAPVSSDLNVLSERIVAQGRTITLTEADLEGITRIQIEAIASDVTIKLPGPPARTTETTRLGDVSFSDGGRSGSTSEPLDVDLIITATLSDVEVEYP